MESEPQPRVEPARNPTQGPGHQVDDQPEEHQVDQDAQRQVPHRPGGPAGAVGQVERVIAEVPFLWRDGRGVATLARGRTAAAARRAAEGRDTGHRRRRYVPTRSLLRSRRELMGEEGVGAGDIRAAGDRGERGALRDCHVRGLRLPALELHDVGVDAALGEKAERLGDVGRGVHDVRRRDRDADVDLA